MGTELVTMQQLDEMAESIVRGGMFGCKDVHQAKSLLLLAQAEGVHPMTAVRDFHIINGKPSRKAESIMARFLSAGGKVVWISYTPTEVCGRFTHPQGGEVTVHWSIDRASKIKAYNNKKKAWIPLTESNPNYRAYPAAMLRSRCISEGVRTVYPAAIGGVLSDVEAMDAAHVAPERDMGEAEEVPVDPAVIEAACVAARAAAQDGKGAFREYYARLTAGERGLIAGIQDEINQIAALHTLPKEQALALRKAIVEAPDLTALGAAAMEAQSAADAVGDTFAASVFREAAMDRSEALQPTPDWGGEE